MLATRRSVLCSLAAAAATGRARANTTIPNGQIRFGMTVADNVAYAPVLAAQELGLFVAAGLKVTIVPLRGAAVAEEALVAGHVDLIDHVIAYAARAIARERPARIVATATNGFYGWSLIVREDSPARTLADLTGRRIGVGARLSVSEMAAQRLVDQSSGRFELVHSGAGALVPALRKGELDAVLFSAVVAQREVVSGYARTIHDLTDPADRTALHGYSASREAREKRGGEIRAFLAAVLQATEHMKKDRAWSTRFLKSFVKVGDDRLSEILHDRIVVNMSDTGATFPDAVERGLALAGRAWNAPDVADMAAEAVFTNRFLPEET